MASNIEWTDETWNSSYGMHPRVTWLRQLLHVCALPSFERHVRRRIMKFEPGKCSDCSNASNAPFKWKKPRRVFVNSMSDVFHPSVPYEFAI